MLKRDMLRASLTAALLLLLSACGRDDALEPFAESQVPPGLAARFQPPEGWAWGFIKSGLNPTQRYGVAAPRGAPKATVVISPGYGESAEVWFETTRDLIAEGCTVWILERTGQGGSGRYASPRQMGHAPSFDPDVTGLLTLLNTVVRAPEGVPVILLGHADGALVPLAAVQGGLSVELVIASAPDFARASVVQRGLPGFERTPAPDWKAWTRDGPSAFSTGATRDPWRGKVGMAWQLANPDLRLTGPSLGWQAAHRAASRKVQDRAKNSRTPILIVNPDSGASAFCRAAASCVEVRVEGARSSPHLEADPWRAQWSVAVTDRIRSVVEDRRVAARATG